MTGRRRWRIAIAANFRYPLRVSLIPTATFAPLAAIPQLQHAFTLRTADHDTRSETFAQDLARQCGFPACVTAEQPHGNIARLVTHPGTVPQADALVTRQRGLPLTIRCADCAPVFLYDRQSETIALIHSGKKGTAMNVVAAALAHLNPGTCVALIGPSIGPCHYEVDLWSTIEAQLRHAGVTAIHNPRICTACHLDRYYSYRAEKGQTGRMFALLALRQNQP